MGRNAPGCYVRDRALEISIASPGALSPQIVCCLFFVFETSVNAVCWMLAVSSRLLLWPNKNTSLSPACFEHLDEALLCEGLKANPIRSCLHAVIVELRIAEATNGTVYYPVDTVQSNYQLSIKPHGSQVSYRYKKSTDSRGPRCQKARVSAQKCNVQVSLCN